MTIITHSTSSSTNVLTFTVEMYFMEIYYNTHDFFSLISINRILGKINYSRICFIIRTLNPCINITLSIKYDTREYKRNNKS